MDYIKIFYEANEEHVKVPYVPNPRFTYHHPSFRNFPTRKDYVLDDLAEGWDDILIVEKPRVPEDGCRWMPATFIGPGMSDMTNTAVSGKPGARGLRVELPGFFLLEAHRRAKCQFRSVGLSMLSFLVYCDIRIIMIPKEAGFQWQLCENMELAILIDGGLREGAMMIPGILWV